MYFTNVTMTLHLIRDQEYAQIPLGVSHAVKKIYTNQISRAICCDDPLWVREQQKEALLL